MMPFSHHFGSTIYDVGEQNPTPVGEYQTDHKWLGGKPPYPVTVGGLCGTQEQWTIGALTTDPNPKLWPGSFVPVCCPRPVPGLEGAIAISGRFVASAASAAAGCSPCPVAPLRWNCTVSGVTTINCSHPPGCDTFNSTVVLEYQGSCIWEGDFGPVCSSSFNKILLEYSFGHWVIVTSDSMGGSVLTLVNNPFNCLGTNHFSGSSSGVTDCGGAHIQAVISPA